MKKVIIGIFILILWNYAKATTYYVKAAGGTGSGLDDTNAWSLSKLNSSFSSLNPGDIVLLKRGDTFTGTAIVINASGSAGSPITIGAYGTGAKPIVSGAIALTWTSLGGSIYESQTLTLSAINLVVRAGVTLPIARYPNDDQANDGYIKNTSFTYSEPDGTVSASSGTIGAIPAYTTGAELINRTTNWTIDRDITTSRNSTTIGFTKHAFATQAIVATSLYTPKTGYGFFLQNDVAFLDKDGEWWQAQTGNKKIRLFSTSGTPAGVTTTSLTNLVTCGAFDYVTIQDIDFKNANGDMFAFTSSSGSNITVQRCKIDNSGGTAFYTTGTFTRIYYDTITNSLNDAVLSYAADTKVSHCVIRNTGMVIGLGGSSDAPFAYCGINYKADRGLIEYTSMVNTGGTGIYCSRSSDYDTIQYNTIDSCVIWKKDAGGIYFFGKTNTTPNVGRVCIYNIVSNCLGGIGGSGSTLTDAYAFYFDQEASGVYLDHNTGYFSSRGVMLNPGCNTMTVTNNTFYGNSYHQAYFSMGDTLSASNDPADYGLVNTLGSITQGSGYTNASYSDVLLNSNITGTGLLADITVSGGHVTSVTITDVGSAYIVGEVLTASTGSGAGKLGTTGSGFSIPVATVYPQNIVKHNIYFATADTQQIAYFLSGSSGNGGGRNFSTIGIMDSNYYARPTLSDATTIFRDLTTAGTSSHATGDVSLTGWKTFQPTLDQHSGQNLYSYASQAVQDTSIRFEINATASPKTIPMLANYNDPAGNTYVRSITLAAYTSAVLNKITPLIADAPTSDKIKTRRKFKTN